LAFGVALLSRIPISSQSILFCFVFIFLSLHPFFFFFFFLFPLFSTNFSYFWGTNFAGSKCESTSRVVSQRNRVRDSFRICPIARNKMAQSSNSSTLFSFLFSKHFFSFFVGSNKTSDTRT
jgi:hypothetical protein